MKIFLRLTALFLILSLAGPAALAAKATPTPPPVEIASTVQEPPAEIQQVLDIAYREWEELGGKTLSSCNKYTEWRGKGVSFGWCAGFVTWCMLEAGIPQEELEFVRDSAAASEDGLHHVSGVYHCKEASVGKLLRAYQLMERATNIPQKGFLVVYGCSFNKTIHLGLVYDVVDLGGGKYRITTLEGNMSSRVKMYIRDYDMNAEVNTNQKKSTNLSVVPEDERTLPESDHVDYSIPSAKPSNGNYGKYTYYVNRFLMPWVPGDPALSDPEPEVTPEPVVAEVVALTPPVPTPTPAPAEEPAPVPTPTPAPTEEPAAAETAPTEEPAAAETAPTEEPAAAETGPAFPCQGMDGSCPYITRSEDDPFCRHCDRNDNGVEDSKE